ncbi:zinc finger CCCH domain-containing protein 25 [Brachypodium distachyon]|uniref:zinc finger CCCH domain-containing protein 25 n=1 Tax=Brachypodium distachyon TaxID=15368 RepID=UPI0001C74EDB|nr:zinc finger CCCH domain-containing protein 25 [Brachypodium distachyon]XP_024313816.1 zinc finger CCCH domain-containing protein 25 [Brachypodium distachyon]XP_024313817.1 zinc finger CCCH domain-containing protein 25 [Brachypodium distachyon]|eukprot:XP_003563222.1 zinc finger CCCH domain-containing protein 25 [Brachypodium distachyon]
MNPLTQVKRTQVINQKEAALGLSEDASWHAKFKDSAYVFVGGVPYDLTEGDLLAVFAQYGEVVDVNLVRDKATGKSKGFAFVAYEDQRSTVLAVDNLNGAKVLGRIIRVDHVDKYKKKEEEDEDELQKKREERGVCYAFQKGECNRGDACRYSHDEQRNANTGWGSKEDINPKWEHDRHRDPPNKGEFRGVCYAFQKGECSRGDSCRFSHDEQVAVQARGICYAFQKGECNRGASCRFSHDEERNADAGRSSKEDRNARRDQDRHLDPPKSHKKFPSSAADQSFPDRTEEESRPANREGQSSRSEVYRDRDSRVKHGDRSTKDSDRRHEKSPERSRGERHRSDDRYMQEREERSESKRSRNDRDSGGRYERRGDEEAERYGKSWR